MEDILQVKREMWIAIADFPNVLLVVFLAGMCSSILPIHVQICALRPATFLWAGYDHVLLNYSWKSIMDLKQILAHRPTVSCISPAWAYNALSVYKLTLKCYSLQYTFNCNSLLAFGFSLVWWWHLQIFKSWKKTILFETKS